MHFHMEQNGDAVYYTITINLLIISETRVP